MAGKRCVPRWMLPLWAVAALAQTSGPPLTAPELVRAAIENSRALKAAEQRVAESRGLLRQAGVGPQASLQFGGGTGRPLGSPGKEEYSAGYSRPIETGGKREKRLQVAELALRVAEAELAEQKLRLATEVRLRYLDALTGKQKLAAYERLIAASAESLQLIEQRIRLGDAARLDGQLLQVEVSRAQAQQRTLAGRLQVAQSDLRRLCGLDALSLAAAGPPQGQAPEPLAELQRRAVEQRPDLRAARWEEERSGAEAVLSEAQARADITLSAQYALRNERFGDLYGLNAAGAPMALRDRDHSLSLGVTVPLQSRRRNLGSLEAATARALAARALRQHLEASIPHEVEAAWQHWTSASEALEIFSTSVLGESVKNLDVMRQAYALGELRLLDVLNEQRRLIDTELAAIDAEADARRGRIELERAVGGNL